ncbi:unnamed protein product, partial [Choristocarpus tenellus]
VLFPRTEGFPTLLEVVFTSFHSHFFLHHNTTIWQARQYKHCKSRLPEGHAAMSIDFSSQLPHSHQDLTQQEFFILLLTALLTIVWWLRDTREGEKLGGGRIWAHSTTICSEDRSQDNEFVQNAMEMFIGSHLMPFAREYGQTLKVLHIWSDGCGSQFKNRWQMWWVSQAIAKMGISVVHNFFSSCHGKSMADRIGAVVKSAARRLELNG